ncbi:MAG TPA: DUF5009 domain-containing protein [Tepidisphaeraceae bacterium]|nr:DUF5009 domain-containing protein [Tepidisphaeraceae bacterium]
MRADAARRIAKGLHDMTTATLKPLLMAERPLQDDVPPPHLVQPIKAERLASLDIFRGMTIAAMLLVNNPAGWGEKFQYAPLRHADWHGWTMTDLVFPFFLFIVGVAIPFSSAKRSAMETMTRGQMLVGVWTRALSLILLGLLLNGFPTPGDALPKGFTMLAVLRVVAQVFVWVAFVVLLFPWRWRRVGVIIPLAVALVFAILYWAILLANRQALAAGLPESFNFGGGILTPWRMRFPGVLQRIGVCYGVAATIALFFGWRMILASAVVVMSLYTALMLGVSYDGGKRGSLAMEDNFARHVDETVFGWSEAGRNHNYRNYPDNEGLVSTLPAIGSVLLGILVGLRLRSDRPASERGASVLAWGVAVTCIGVLLSWWLMPINKVIWTPSFTVFTAGLAMLGLGAVYYVADIRGRRAWALPFRIYGMNAILAFVLAGLLGRVLPQIRFTHPRLPGTMTTPLEFLKSEIAYGMHQAAAWLGEVGTRLGVSFPPLDAPQNVSLAYALTFVLIILIPLTVLYFCRVFVKV